MAPSAFHFQSGLQKHSNALPEKVDRAGWLLAHRQGYHTANNPGHDDVLATRHGEPFVDIAGNREVQFVNFGRSRLRFLGGRGQEIADVFLLSGPALVSQTRNLENKFPRNADLHSTSDLLPGTRLPRT